MPCTFCDTTPETKDAVAMLQKVADYLGTDVSGVWLAIHALNDRFHAMRNGFENERRINQNLREQFTELQQRYVQRDQDRYRPRRPSPWDDPWSDGLSWTPKFSPDKLDPPKKK